MIRMRGFTPVDQAIEAAAKEWLLNYVRTSFNLPENRVEDKVHHLLEYVRIRWRYANWKESPRIYKFYDDRSNGTLISDADADQLLTFVESKLSPTDFVFGIKLKGWYHLEEDLLDKDWLMQVRRLSMDQPHFKHFDPETCECVLDLTPPDIQAEKAAEYQRRLNILNLRDDRTRT